MMRSAGFLDIRIADSGEEVAWDLLQDQPGALTAWMSHPMTVCGTARKVRPPGALLCDMIHRDRQVGVYPVPVVLRGPSGYDDTAREMLADNTSDYTVIESPSEAGPWKSVNRTLKTAGMRYVAVIGNDVTIHESDWLGHIVRFMERRPDVGLVGFPGYHNVGTDAVPDPESMVSSARSTERGFSPSWRFTEVAVAGALGLVIRDVGLRLDEGLDEEGALDLSLAYRNAGYRVYACAVEYSARVAPGDRLCTESHGALTERWKDLLPLSCGYRDELYGYFRVQELLEQVCDLQNGLAATQEENVRLRTELERAAGWAHELEASLKRGQASPKAEQKAPVGALDRFRYYREREGTGSAVRRSIAKARRALRGGRPPASPCSDEGRKWTR
jgi:hypothetical protein